MVIWIKFTHSSPFQFTDCSSVSVHSCHLLFAHFQFTLIHGPNFQFPLQYCSSQHQTLLSPPETPTTGCCFPLWLSLFIPSGAISLPFSSSILGTYQPGEFIFQCPIFLPFHTVPGVLKARTLKWFAIPFSSGPLCQNSPLWPVHLG